ncbi:hypothetical protein [Rhizobium sp. SU303]|uniref:hypothetical protein n=1 Tax=Rhizobium sp. SU303 TaxID=3138065 RepID=UPI001E43378A|nr:hypothetical protein [Rhizobium leguminosarum]UFW76712.1 hypothetical protein RlegSU303_15745 [Rhizobium leguminosarum bv. viciae]
MIGKTSSLSPFFVLITTWPRSKLNIGHVKRETSDRRFPSHGFSKAAGPQHWLLFCHDREGVCPPFKLVHPGNDVQNGIGLTHEDLARHGISPSEVAKPDFFARFGASFMAIARTKRAVMFGMSTPLHFVGGHCDLTTITEHGVTVERLCTWPDKLGRPVESFAADEPAGWSGGRGVNQLVTIDNGEVLLPDEVIDVYIRRSPLRQKREHIAVPAGLSVEEIIACCGLEPPRLHVSIAGHVIEQRNWARVRVKPGFSVVIVKVPGKGALRAIAGLVVALVAAVAAPWLVGTVLAIPVGAAASVATGLIGAGISLGGSLTIGTLSGYEQVLYAIDSGSEP